MQYTVEQLEAQYQKLPDDVREAMIKVETANVVGNIGRKYNLHIDQIGDLADEIGLTMLGLTKPDEFVSHIKRFIESSKSSILPS